MSDIKVQLRSRLTFTPVHSQGVLTYTVEDRVEQRFWQIGQTEYEVCASIDGSQSLSELMSLLATRPNAASDSSTEKATKVLRWLMQVGLVQDANENAAWTNESYRNPPAANQPPAKEPAKKTFKFLDPSAIRIPAVTGEVLDHYARQMTWMVSIPGLIVAAFTWFFAIILAAQHYQSLADLGKKLFVPGSQWWWLLAWGLLKVVHEAGHAIACARVGGKSKGAGINLMFFAPLPYVDASSIWRVESKWARALVGASGMLFEITFAAVAVIGACILETPSLRFLCVSIATLGTFTTVAFNANPLMRYDGYYIVTDIAGRPNLWQDASKTMKSFFASWIFKTSSRSAWTLPLLVYGIASWCSRMVMLGTMAWGVWVTWDGLGLVVIGFFSVLWFVVPLLARIRLAMIQSNSLPFISFFEAICPRKALRCFGTLVALATCSLLPSPVQIYWPAIVDYEDPSDIRTVAAGFVTEILVHDGQGVREGEELARLSNPSLKLEYSAAKSKWVTCIERCTNLRVQRKHSELQAEEAVCISLEVQCNSLKSKLDSLVLRAPRDGILLARMSHNLLGSYLQEGQSIGLIVNPGQIEVRASIPQYAWELVSKNGDSRVSIHLLDGHSRAGKIHDTLPRTSDELESPTLGGLYGGPIAVVMGKNSKGESQLKSNEPRLQTRIQFEPTVASTSGFFESSAPISLPPPGSLCSVKLAKNNEAIWQTFYRWIEAAFEAQTRSVG
jgi:putative peptide zinc metalloprotease protein